MTTLEEKQRKRLELFLLKQEEKKIKQKLKKKKKPKKKKIVKKETNSIIKKKKVGRPKKRGPKKKRIRRKIVKITKERPVIDFKIISTLNGKQNGYIGCYKTYADAHNELYRLKENNKQVVFPRKYLNSGNISNLKDEYLLLEKNRNGDKNDGILRNEFGKLVEHKIINNTNWIIRDKIQRCVEETFWVYGYDPKTERKDVTWIIDNLLLNSIETPYDIIRILVYKNKLIIKYDNMPMNMIMCKNKSDCIRLYNFISDKIRSEKIRQIVCIGAYNIISDSRREIEKDIMELTGWDKIKIQRCTN